MTRCIGDLSICNANQKVLSMTLEELFDFYCRKRLRAGSPDTIRLYKHSIKAFEKSLGRPATVSDFTDDNLEDHMWKIVNSGLSVPSANKDYCQLSAMWRFAHRNRLVETWPNVRPIPEPERVPLGWTQDELDRLFAAIDQTEGSIGGAPARIWWRTLINLVLDTGERIGGVRDLTRAHLHGDYILVPSKYRKRKTRDKLYKLSQWTKDDISLLLTLHRSEEIFPWTWSKTYIYDRYEKILKKAQLPADSRSKFHRIRRTVASAVANQGGNPSTALDHSSPKTTKLYLDPRIVQEVATSTLVAKWREAPKEKP